MTGTEDRSLAAKQCVSDAPRSSGRMHVCPVTQPCPTPGPHGLWPARLLCPWDSPGKNTGVHCHALLQGIFPTQGSNLGFLMSPALEGSFFTTSTTREAPISPHFLFRARAMQGPPASKEAATPFRILPSLPSRPVGLYI